MTSRSFKDLIAWQKAMDLAVLTYRATVAFPRDEQYGLTSQARRAASSIPANISEGQARRASRDFRRFLLIALGSNAELQTCVLLAQRLEMLQGGTAAEILSASDEVGRLVAGLVNSLSPAPDDDFPPDSLTTNY